jgi:hypothetical protein
LLYEGRTLQGARPKLADFCSATMAEFYSAVDTIIADPKPQRFSEGELQAFTCCAWGIGFSSGADGFHRTGILPIGA